jgi:MFS family permease
VILFPLMPTLVSATAMLAGLLFFGAFAYGAAASSLQLITPNTMRATVSAFYLVVVNLVGLTAGPVVTGALTDYVFRSPGAVGISAALVGGFAACLAACVLLLAVRPYRVLASQQAAA